MKSKKGSNNIYKPISSLLTGLFFTCLLQAQIITPALLAKQWPVKKIYIALPMDDKMSEVSVSDINGLAIMEGDIILGKTTELEKVWPKAILAINGSRYRWPGGQMPYLINNNFSQAQVNAIVSAIGRLNQITNLSIYPRSAEEDYIHIEPATTNASSVGKQGSKQRLLLANGFAESTVMHEFLHAAGLYHTQSRSDRDAFVEIIINNVQPGFKHNFDKYNSTATDIGNYDYCSIMHYHSTAFGIRNKNGTQNITLKSKKTPPCTPGTANTLSNADIQGVNSIYPSRSSKPWQLLSGSDGSDITTDATGVAYLVNRNGIIYRQSGNGWTQIAGANGRSISANGGNLFLVNKAGNIFRWDTNRWTQINGTDGVDIAVSSDGRPWLVNKAGRIYQWRNNKWEIMPGGNAVRIAAGGDQVWMINKNGLIYRWTGSNWNKMPGSKGWDIAVGNDGTVWLTNTTGNIYKWNGAGWSQIYGSDGSTISVNDSRVHLVNTKGKIYRLDY